jgi:hypothetical protein
MERPGEGTSGASLPREHKRLLLEGPRPLGLAFLQRDAAQSGQGLGLAIRVAEVAEDVQGFLLVSLGIGRSAGVPR